jgi:hypothetical protein
MVDSPASPLLQMLRSKIANIASSQTPRASSRVSTGMAAFDALLPQGGLRGGMVVELVSATDGAGAWTLGLMLARRACRDGQFLLVVDGQTWFYPATVGRLGFDLRQCFVVRPARWQEAHAAIAQALRCRGVGCVVCWCERMNATDYHRLRLAAESGGTLGILVRPIEALSAPTRASVRFLVSPVASGTPARRFRVEVLRGRGHGQALIVEIDDETGDVRLSASMARPAAPA